MATITRKGRKVNVIQNAPNTPGWKIIGKRPARSNKGLSGPGAEFPGHAPKATLKKADGSAQPTNARIGKPGLVADAVTRTNGTVVKTNTRRAVVSVRGFKEGAAIGSTAGSYTTVSGRSSALS